MEVVRPKKKKKTKQRNVNLKDVPVSEASVDETEVSESETVIAVAVTDNDIPSVPSIIEIVDTNQNDTSTTISDDHNDGEVIVTTQTIINNETVSVETVDEATVSVTSDNLPSNVELEDNSTCEQIMTQKMTESDITQSTVDIDQSTVLLKNDNHVITVREVETPSAPVIMECEIRYPRLDSLMEAAIYDEVNEDLTPFTEEDLALMYVNPQLVANQEFVENFIRDSEQSHHPLYELLNQYLKARLSLRTIEAKLDDLKRSYTDGAGNIWEIEEKSVSSTARCRDGTKVTDTHSYKFAQLNNIALGKTVNSLKQLRNCLQEELCLKSYSTQLAHIHIEYYLHQLLQSSPGLSTLPPNSPVTGYIPDSPPGCLDYYTTEIRNCVSVLCMFERRPVRDTIFTTQCKQWLDLMVNALLRVASLSDHLFVLNHLLRCPPGVGEWGVKYLQPLSPVTHKGVTRPNTGPTGSVYDSHQDGEYSLNWISTTRGHEWSGSILDHWITMLCTLLMPISGREEMLCMLETNSSPLITHETQRWTLVEDDLEEEVIDEDSSLQLKESDYISFLDQFPFNEIFKYILQVTDEGSYSCTSTTSYQMLQLISFSTCLIRILGTVFSSLRQSRYKEFVKQVGRTVRLVVQYVADHWLNYKSCKERQGDTSSTVPMIEQGPYRYSLDRLQTEFDLFVLRATQWILTAHKLGAWQFMADIPYSSVSLLTLWKILWTLYHYQFSSGDRAGNASNDIYGKRNEYIRGRVGSVLSGRLDLDMIPTIEEDLLSSIREPSCHAKFIDVLMKTYTSEAVFLLTTFVNMARSRIASNSDEIRFIDTVTEEIFQFTQVEEYARDTYNRTGCSLLGTIASVHPFIISTLLRQTQSVITDIGENCNLLFKELPLHLWIPTKSDMSIVYNWLVYTPLSSHENITAKIIISGLNWGVKENEDQQNTTTLSLILPLSLHREVSLYLVEASSRHLSSLPGGHEYNSSLSSIRKYASSIRSMMSTEQSEFTSWLWEIVLMLKLHPTQLSLISILPPSPLPARSTGVHSSTRKAKDPSVYKKTDYQWDATVDTMLPDLSDTSVNRLGILKESVEREGILGYYVALCVTNLGSICNQFINEGLPMLYKLIDQGYYLPVLRILGNVIPLMFRHRKMFIDNQSFTTLLVTVANADIHNASYKDFLTWNTPSPLIVRRLSAMITTQVLHWGSSLADKQQVILFWLDSLFAMPNWLRDQSVLYLLNGLCITVYGNMPLEQLLLEQLLDQYEILQPLQSKNRYLISSVASSMISIVGQDGGSPSLSNNINPSEYPWLSYYVLRAEQMFEDKEGIWKTLLSYLKKDQKISIDNALKKALTELNHNGSPFTTNQLSIFKWSQFAINIDHNFLLAPLVWQRFFTLYLQRTVLNHSSPERGSMGLRLFSNNQKQSLRREMKSSLSKIVNNIQEEIDNINKTDNEEMNKDDIKLVEFLPVCLRYYQTLKLWIQEPRLHDDTLYLPGLPQQYDSNKLKEIFKPHQQDWIEFVKLWDIQEMVKLMVYEWGQVVSYQTPLPCQMETRESSPETAASRIERRLRRFVAPVPPSPFQLPPAPFSLLSSQVLLSKDALLSSVIHDTEFVAQQARIFTERVNNLSALDAEYISGIPDLYDNADRQCHNNVPCRSKYSRSHECLGPAIIVFRFKEMTAHAHWKERLTDNRRVQNELVNALSIGVPVEMCRAVARVEHAVGELVKLALTNNNEALSSGVALFYEILKFISVEIERFPPSSQFFTCSVEILGQEFIQNDPGQTINILQLIVNQRTLAKLLSPIFIPNSCPTKFLSMYCTVADVLIKDGPDIAFSVLSKFNIIMWLKEYTPSLADSTILLDHIFNGIKTTSAATSSSSPEERVILEVYVTHLRYVIQYQFPMLYNDALFHLVSGTETSSIVCECWDEVLNVVCPPSQSNDKDMCRLGLQLVLDSAKYLANHFTQKRLYTKEYLYDLMPQSYVASIGRFINMLANSVIIKTIVSIELNNVSPSQGLTDCWHVIIDLFTPWIFPLHHTESSEAINLFPCKIEDSVLMSEILQLFAETFSTMQNAFKVHEVSSFSLLWPHYCNQLALYNIPEHVLQCYHIHLSTLPWQDYQPNLESMDLMLQLKLDSSYPAACFIFLGDIVSLIDWRLLAEHYCSSQDVLVKFHITLLQLLVMLSAEMEVMEKKDAKLPYLLSKAKSYQFHFIDSSTFNDVLLWLKDNCNPTAVLHPGSPLSSSLRFLQAVASFPIPESDESNLLQTHLNGWEKRYSYIRLVVELVTRASHHKETHTLSYTEIIAFLIQTIVDVSVYEQDSCYSAQVIALLQEILNLFNTCDPSKPFQYALIDNLSSCLMELQNAQYICVPTMVAACRTVVSIPLMASIVENSIIAYFKYHSLPACNTVQLPPSGGGYGWDAIKQSVVVPEAAYKEFTEHCIVECACLSLNTRLMQLLSICTSLEQEYKIACDIVQWCTKLKPKCDQESGVFLIWEKTQNLLLRQIKYGGNVTKIVPHFTTLATMLLRYGEDKATEGLLGAIGLGKKSSFSIQFRLVSRIIATFIHCQMPMDSNHSTIIRISPNAPGHIKTTTRQYSIATILPSKQADLAIASLEGLLSNKNYLPYKEYISYSLDFINDSRFCLFDSAQLLVYLLFNMYCNDRCLDVLRVITT